MSSVFVHGVEVISFVKSWKTEIVDVTLLHIISAFLVLCNVSSSIFVFHELKFLDMKQLS